MIIRWLSRFFAIIQWLSMFIHDNQKQIKKRSWIIKFSDYQWWNLKGPRYGSYKCPFFFPKTIIIYKKPWIISGSWKKGGIKNFFFAFLTFRFGFYGKKKWPLVLFIFWFDHFLFFNNLIADYSLIIHDYSWLFMIIHDYSWLFMIIHDYSGLFRSSTDYRFLDWPNLT